MDSWTSWIMEQRECRRMALGQQQEEGGSSSSSSRRGSELGSLPLQEGEDLGLPDHLLCRILASLPVLKIFQIRLVCKSWNSLLQSPTFSEARSAVEAAASTDHDDCWFVMARKLPVLCAKEFIAYCPSLRKWFPLPLQSPSIYSSLGHFSVCVASTNFYDASAYGPVHGYSYFDECGPGDNRLESAFLMASAGGLVCCVVNGVLQEEEEDGSLYDFNSEFVFDPSNYTVLVLDPLTGAVKRLPPPPKHYYIYDDTRLLSISMVANPTATDSYHVALHDVGCYDHMEIYDSRSSSWKVGQPIASAKFTGDVLNADLFSYDFKQGLLFAYTAESNEWSKIRVHCPLPLPSPTVLRCKGRLLLVSSGEYPDITQFYRVWEVQTSSYGVASCIEVAVTPPEYRGKIYEYDFESIQDGDLGEKFITNGTLICMTGVHYPEFSDEGRYWPPLVYDLELDCWYRLPLYKDPFDFVGLFSFRPRLTAIVCSEGDQN